jgi:hypothetical protein
LFPHNLAAQTKDIAITLTAQIDSLVKNTKPDDIKSEKMRALAEKWIAKYENTIPEKDREKFISTARDVIKNRYE